jgi:hypothetical protein
MKSGLILAGLLLGLGCGVQAQVVDTTVCDVVKKPASFNGKMVRIKGTVVAGFDQFIIKDVADPNCGFQENAIWLSYPQGTKSKAGPVVMVTVQPAQNFTGKYEAPARTPVAFEKDKNFKQFDSLLAQTHQKGADMCLGCTRYEVTATLVGRLDSVSDPVLKRDAAGKIVSFGGFGNMNAYPARLVLQSVTDVTPKEIDFSKTDAAAKGDAMPGFTGDPHVALDPMQKAVEKLSPSPAKDETVRALGAFGKPGENNGVIITTSGAANEASAKDESLSAKDSPDGVQFNCYFNVDRLTGLALSRAIVHVGEHVADLRKPKPGNEDVPAIFLENNAWAITTIAGVMSGQKFLTLPGAYQIWNTSWPAAERNEKMISTLKDFLNNEAMLSQ